MGFTDILQGVGGLTGFGTGATVAGAISPAGSDKDAPPPAAAAPQAAPAQAATAAKPATSTKSPASGNTQQQAATIGLGGGFDDENKTSLLEGGFGSKKLTGQ